MTAQDIYICSSHGCTKDSLPSEDVLHTFIQTYSPCCCCCSAQKHTHIPKFLPAHLFCTNTTVFYSLGQFFEPLRWEVLKTQIKKTDKQTDSRLNFVMKLAVALYRRSRLIIYSSHFYVLRLYSHRLSHVPPLSSFSPMCSQIRCVHQLMYCINNSI